MVPFLKFHDENIFYYPFENPLWILIFSSVFYLTLIIFKVFECSITTAFLNAVSFTAFTPYFFTLERNSFKKVFVFTMLTVYGFVLTIFYTSKISAFLTSQVIGQQIFSLEDLSNQNITEISSSGSLDGFVKILGVPITWKYEDMEYDFINLNTNYSYIVSSHQWDYINEIQTRFSKKLFNFTDICNSLFEDRMYIPFDPEALSYHGEYELFKLLVDQSGLMSAWKTQTIWEYTKNNIGKDHYDAEEIVRPLGFIYFSIIFKLLLICYLVCFVVFFLELICAHDWNTQNIFSI